MKSARCVQGNRTYSKSFRLLTLVLASILILFCFASCKKKSTTPQTQQPTKNPTQAELITERISIFVTAYNAGDFDTVLSCLDQRSKNALQAMINLMGSIAGSLAGFNIDLSDLFSLGVSTTSGDFMDLQIKKISILTAKDATVTTTMNLANSGEKTIYFIMVYENGGWYIKDMTDEKTGSDTIQNDANITILDSSNFYSRSYVKYSKDGKSYYGIVNSKGEIVHVSEEYTDHYLLGNDSFLLIEEDGNTKSYTLLNSNGKTSATFNSTAFDDILGYGGGLLLVYKNTSTIAKEEHSYGVLDASGNWVAPLTAGRKLPLPSGGYGLGMYEYYGNGIFVATEHGGYSNYSILFNMYTFETFKLEDCYIRSDSFVDGAIYVNNKNCYFNNSELCSPHDCSYNERVSLPGNFVFYSDGTYEAIEDFNTASGHLLINTTGQYVKIINKKDNTEKEFKNYPMSMISSVKFDGDFGVITINGVDGKTYLTVIDKDCNELIDPIVGTNAEISENRIVYKNKDNIYEVIDTNGKVIVSKDMNCEFITTYQNGYALAEIDDVRYLIGYDGQLFNLKFK